MLLATNAENQSALLFLATVKVYNDCNKKREGQDCGDRHSLNLNEEDITQSFVHFIKQVINKRKHKNMHVLMYVNVISAHTLPFSLVHY